MSLCFLEKCALTSLIGLLPATVAFAQSTPPEGSLSANELAPAVVANELKVQDGKSKSLDVPRKEEQGEEEGERSRPDWSRPSRLVVSSRRTRTECERGTGPDSHGSIGISVKNGGVQRTP